MNPLSNARFYVDPHSNAQTQVNTWASTRPSDADEIRKIAAQPQAFWFNEWTGPVQSTVDARTTEIAGAGALPVFVAYNIPLRDCGSYSGGGAVSAEAYRSWIRGFADGLRGRRAVVLLEPDALAGIGCLSAARQTERLGLLREAVEILKRSGNVSVYLDAGHPAWVAAGTMANRLNAAGIATADGFALNISNYQTTASNIAYGTAISGLTGGKHFVIDTSRNGAGPAAGGEWCNPSGRRLGASPTTATGNALVDALLWVKRPGESDGTCNGGPPAGRWFVEWALDISSRTTGLLAYAG
ncbi:MAG TPA: glycoside hydrolase family 6 protein [Longimicrobiales bacterium]